MKSYTFYNITVPDADYGPDWAARMGNIYGFDFDLERTDSETVLAWPMDTEEEFERGLLEDGIRFSKFQVRNLTSFLGL